MATVNIGSHGTACQCGEKIFFYHKRDDGTIGKTTLVPAEQRPNKTVQVKGQAGEEGSTPDGGGGGGGDGNYTPTDNIVACKFSRSGDFLAVCDDKKYLYVYDIKNDCRLLNTRTIPRRCTSLTFTADERRILVADKTGNVHCFGVQENKEKDGLLLLGHFSVLLDMLVTDDDKFVVTCDRDEKVRVSHFPNCYSIYSYCMGHKEFVSSIVYMTDHKLLASGGGDGRIIVWTMEGQKKSQIECDCGKDSKGEKEEEEEGGIRKMIYDSKYSLIVALYYGCKKLDIFHISADGTITLSQTINTAAVPWDICFDSNSFLWLLQPIEGETITIIRCLNQENINELTKLDSKDLEDFQDAEIVHHINSLWASFKVVKDEGFSIVNQSLKKVHVDNMADYLERKQERIAGEMAKLKDNTGDKQPPEKKAKTS